MLSMARHAERLEVVQVMKTTQGGVPALTSDTVVNFKAILAARRAPGVDPGIAAGRTLGGSMAATDAAPSVTTFSRPARHGPPVIAPEVVAAG